MQAVTGSLLLVFTLLLTACSPEAPVRFADGSFTQSSHWDGRWLVINYWAEWCAPCRDEIPELNELHHARVNHGLVMLGVNWDGLQREKLTAVIERMGIEFPVLSEDPYLQYGYERAQQLPVTVLINPERVVTEQIRQLLEHPGALQVLNFAEGRVQLVAVKAYYGGPLVGQELSSLRQRMPNIDTRVAAIFRRGKAIIPEGSTVIEALAEMLAGLRNDLEAPARGLVPELDRVLARIGRASEVLLTRMSGSGATCFGLFERQDAGQAAAAEIAHEQPDWWVRVAPLLHGPLDRLRGPATFNSA